MELIDKSVLVAEIERRISNHNKELKNASDEDFVSSWASDEENQKLALTALIPFINTLEVREVDLENSMTCKVGWYDGFLLDYTQEQQDELLKKIGANVGDKIRVTLKKE